MNETISAVIVQIDLITIIPLKYTCIIYATLEQIVTVMKLPIIKTLVALPVTALLVLIIGFYRGGLHQKCKFKYAKKKWIFVRKPTPPPRTKETYYNMPPFSEQDNDVELQTEQRNVKPKCPTAMYYYNLVYQY